MRPERTRNPRRPGPAQLSGSVGSASISSPRSCSGDKDQLEPLIRAAMAHNGFAFIDVVSPCVTFNNHEGSTKSLKYIRGHLDPLHDLDFIPPLENIEVDYDAIPVNARLLAYLRGQKRAGRRMHLVSAANQRVVDAAAERFGIFDSATGSSGAVNLKGRRKLEFIRENIGSEFVYVGDSDVDAETAQRAGVSFAFFTEGIRTKPIDAIPHDRAFDRFEDLPAICQEILRPI